MIIYFYLSIENEESSSTLERNLFWHKLSGAAILCQMHEVLVLVRQRYVCGGGRGKGKGEKLY